MPGYNLPTIHPPPPSNPRPEEKSEKKEFLLREEIRTMKKDITKLQEAEAQKERERIAALKTEEEAKKEREKTERVRRKAEERRKNVEEKVRGKKEEAKELEKPKPPPEKPALPKKPLFFGKVFIRVVIIIILLLTFALIFTFWYWYLKVRKAPLLFPEKPPAEEVIPLIKEDPEKLEIVIFINSENV